MTETPLRSIRGGKLLIPVIALIGGVLILGRLFSDLYVEFLWYRSTGYTAVFARRLTWLWTTRLVWGGLVAITLVVSLRLVARTLGGIQIKRRFGNLEIIERLPPAFVWWGIGAVSLLLGASFGGAVPESVSWAVMVALQGGEWGLVEPVLGRDVSFYAFTLPLLRTAVAYLMLLAFLVFLVSVAGYAATGAVRWGKGGIIMGDQPRIHLGLVVALFLGLMAVRFWLSRSSLLMSGNSAVQGIFGFADAEARLPALRAMAVVTMVAAGSVAWGVWKNRLIPVASGFGTVVLGTLVVLQFYPSLVQRFRVEPNELERETRYIEHNIEFTRIGFSLAGLERRVFQYRPLDTTDWAAAQAQFEGLPVWTASVLLTMLRATESRFPYYEFETVDFSRYPAGESGEPVPVAISVREIDAQGIQDRAWQNLHLRQLYIAGMGAVAASAAGRTAEGRPPMFLSGIPPEFTGGPNAPQGLRLDRPQVFFGSRQQRDQAYAIVNAGVASERIQVLPTEDGLPGDGPLANGDGAADRLQGIPGVDYPVGILLNSTLRKLAMAWRFREPNLLFTSEVTDSSRMVFRRQVQERAQEIAPFFRYPEPPYPVVADGRIVWILEGFTATSGFPLSRLLQIEPGVVASYVRNSIKVTVDAVTGETNFYAVSEEDPLRDAYARVFPGLLRPIDEMPENLRTHLRYSKTLLSTQVAVLLQYHQGTAPRFHGQQDVWQLPTEFFQSTSPVPYRPEYGIYRLPGEDTPTFNLSTAFVPTGRQNLTGMLVGRLVGTGTPELILYDVPVEDQAPGPRQIEALVEQDPEISQQFSLWRSGGSQVWLGHLHLVPVGSQLFYMEPVFLAATDQAIPDLRRFLVSDGRRVSMEPTIEAALAALAGDRAPSPPERARDDALPFGDTTGWSQEALDLLDLAENRLRVGDWQGFGAALGELRQMLQRMSPPGG